MAVYWQPGSGAYLPPQGDAGGGRRGGGVAASPPASLLRPGYPAVTMPPAQLARYGLPGAVPPNTFTAAAAYSRQPTVQADPRNPRHPLRSPYPFPSLEGVQLLTGVGGANSLLAQGAAAAALSTIVSPEVHAARRHRPVVDARPTPGSAPPGPTAPLTIETREPRESAGYQPQVEAISPTPEDRPAERDDIKSTKDNLLQKIAKVDREIAKAESQIAKLKKKQEELEDAANKPSTDSASEDEKPNQSIAQNVYSENRRKAAQSHAMLNKFSPGNLLPLYNQPSDTEVYNKNKKEYTVFKKQLVEYFKRKNEEAESRDRFLNVTYCKLSSDWNRKVDRVENSKKRREREAKCREMYEKLFPELRKQREDKERNERLGTRGTVRSDQEFQDVIDRIQEHELEEKKMHSYAVVPPPLLPPEERKRKYINKNGLMADPLLVYNERKFVNMWTDSEKETFKEKYIQHPKNFFMIAQYLERKSVSDCVQYYYLSKKTENYKQIIRKNRSKNTRARRINNPTGEVIAPNVTGVVTRRTVTALQEKEGEKGTSRSNTPQPNNKDKDGDDATNGEKETGRPRRSVNNKKVEAAESSDDEDSNQAVKCGPFPCVVCKTTVDSSRPVTKAQAAQLGVKEDEITDTSRVCQTCWCKTLRTKCPLLTCSTAGKNKKLRALPLKWKELSPALKETVSSELQIPEGTKQVCTTCFGRINKRISQAQEDELNSDKGATRDNKETYKVGETMWSTEEVTFLEMGLRTEGKDWTKIASKVPEKNARECRKFFRTYCKKLGLDEIVADFKKSMAGAGDKPSLSSDEEEYTTSSCDEENDKSSDKKKEAASDDKTGAAVSSADKSQSAVSAAGSTAASTSATTTTTTTASADAPVAKREDGYDSAATISADETHEQDKKTHSLPPSALLPPPASSQQQVMVTTAPGGATVVTVGPPVSLSVAPGMKPSPIGSSGVSAATFLQPSSVVGAAQMMGMPPVTKTIYVKDIMNTVIDQTLRQPNAHQPRTAEVSSIKDLLHDQHTNASLPPGFVKPPPELEVKPVPGPGAGPPPPSAAAPPSGGPAPVLVEDSGVLNLTTTKRDRSPQTLHSSHSVLSEPVYKSTYVERGGAPNFGHPQPVSRNEKPPDAHSDSKKTTHRETMKIEDIRLSEFNKEMSNHLGRQDMVSSYSKGYSQSGHKLEGSITRGQPIPQLPNVHQGSASSRYHPGLQKSMTGAQRSGGSLVTGTPVYTDQRNVSMNSSDARASQSIDMMKKQQQGPGQVSRYSPYVRPPASHETNSRGSTSRRVIENDYMTAQSLPRKDPHDDMRSPYPRNVDHRDRDIQIVETHPRFDQRPNIYGNPRGPHPYGPIRTDPKADIPPRDPIRPDPRAETHDPRFQADPRGRPTFPGYSNSLPLRQDARSRSPPRTAPSSRSMSSSGLASVANRPGSITSGLPRNSIEIHRQQQPEVSITKQTVNQISRPDYPNTNLANFADIALQQPKMTDLSRSSGVGTSASSSLTVTRTDANNQSRLQADMKAMYDRAMTAAKMSNFDPRFLPREQQELLKQLEDKQKYPSPYGDRHVPLNTEQVIEMIVATQIKNNLQTPNAAVAAAAVSGLTPGINSAYGLAVNSMVPGAVPRLDGKESPSKQPSRSPLVKEGLDDRNMLMRTSPAGVPNTMEHLEAMKKDSQKNRTSPYPIPPTTAASAAVAAEMHEYWKRTRIAPGVDPAYLSRPPSQSGSLPRPGSGGMAAPSSMGTSDERQIVRVAQNASPRSDKGSVSGRPAVEAISPPTSDPARSTPNYTSYQDVNPAISRFLQAQRKPNEIDPAAAQSSGAVFDYVKRKINEVMQNDKTVDPRSGAPASLTMGPPNKRPLDGDNSRNVGNPGGPTDLSSDSPRKRHKPEDPQGGGGTADLPDSPGSGEMVIDESARPDSAHSQKTTSPAPHPSDYSNYRGPPGGGALPPRSSPGGAPPPRVGGPMPPVSSSGGPSQAPPPGAPPGTRYEPLSDDD